MGRPSGPGAGEPDAGEPASTGDEPSGDVRAPGAVSSGRTDRSETTRCRHRSSSTECEGAAHNG
ncbi:hypothetical protein Ae505Ps2_5838c [Pseudonocardia sp. Ae505_Ps2]|nr:hypothetical protein Ae505Ps2_5838c [Pseudonocardia sp. Ae505_Ps2]